MHGTTKLTVAVPRANRPWLGDFPAGSRSVLLAVSPALLDVLQLRAGSTVGMVIDDGRVVIEPASRPTYTLAELLARCDPAAARSDEDSQWLEVSPVGTEIL